MLALGGGAYDMMVYGICQFFERWYGDVNEKWTVLGISVTQRWRENTIADTKYYVDGIYTKIGLWYYGNFRKNQW